jgi:hypothetical protein
LIDDWELWNRTDMNRIVMKKILCLLISLYSLSSCGQTKPSIRLVGVYADIKYPGNIPVDDNGNPMRSGPDTAFTMLVEAGKEAIKWGYVFYGNQVYTVIPSRIKKLPFEVKAKESGNKIRLKPAAGKQFWQLELVPFTEYRKVPDTLRAGNFMLQVKYGKNSFRLVTGKFTEIDSPPSV